MYHGGQHSRFSSEEQFSGVMPIHVEFQVDKFSNSAFRARPNTLRRLHFVDARKQRLEGNSTLLDPVGGFPIIWTIPLIKNKIVDLRVDLKAIHLRAREVSNRAKAGMWIIRQGIHFQPWNDMRQRICPFRIVAVLSKTKNTRKAH